MKVTINLPETFTVSKRNGASVEIETAKIDPESLAIAALMGAAEKVRNSTAETEGTEGDVETMTHTRDRALYAGEWNVRGAGSASDPLDPYRIAVVRDYMKTAKGADLKAAHDAIDSTEQKARREFLLAFAKREDNAAKIDKIAAERKAVDDAERKRAESLDLDFDAA